MVDFKCKEGSECIMIVWMKIEVGLMRKEEFGFNYMFVVL